MSQVIDMPREFVHGAKIAQLLLDRGFAFGEVMYSVSFCRLALVFLVMATAGVGSALASPALDFTGGTVVTNQPGRNITIGYAFQVDESIAVDALAYYNYQGTVDHEVGLWNSAGSLLASATVSATDSVIGQFRYHTISDVILTVGDTYVVGGLNLGGEWVHSVPLADMVIASQIAYVQNRYTSPNNSALSLPLATFPGENFGYFGGSFGFHEIPEPASLSLALLGIILAAGISVSRRNHLVCFGVTNLS